MWLVSPALPSSFSENETKGLLIKPRARRLKCHMGPQEAWVGRGGVQGGLRLLPLPAASRQRAGRKKPWPRTPRAGSGLARVPLGQSLHLLSAGAQRQQGEQPLPTPAPSTMLAVREVVGRRANSCREPTCTSPHVTSQASGLFLAGSGAGGAKKLPLRLY